jgi:hypothetical protein
MKSQNFIKIDFRIPIYQKNGIGFEIIDYVNYLLTFKLKNKSNKYIWSICVNGVKTNRHFDVSQYYHLNKDILLAAISDYVNNRNVNKNGLCKQFITYHKLMTEYKSKSQHTVNNKLLKMTKEMNRDRLTKYNLILFNVIFLDDNESIPLN